jgi:hydroxyacylglutathione hydrolase
MLEIVTWVLGPVQTNTYLVADSETGAAVVIDPAWEGKTILADVQAKGWRLGQIWITHAHFDHMAGVAEIVRECGLPLGVALHPEDLPLWKMKGGALLFGMDIGASALPDVALMHAQILQVGNYAFEVRHVPGHTPGHVIFYCPSEKLVFCGDSVFAGSIGRTDLPGGDYDTLVESIQMQILTLPDETRLLPGHGEETTVGVERRNNPFLR